MALDISKVTDAINTYLYSISDVNKLTQELSDSDKTSVYGDIFQKYLAKAIADETGMSDMSEATDVVSALSASASAADAVSALSAGANSGTASTAAQSGTNSATSNNQGFGVTVNDELAQRINSVFQEIDIESEIAENIASHTVDISSQIQQNIDSHDRFEELNNAVTALKETEDANTNSDAYSGLLGTKALQELADSSYFTGNLLQSSLIGGSSDDDNTTSLSDLNNNSLLASSLGTSSGILSQSDYASALLNAYKSSPVTSVFGDFQI